jgi:hypothetical protein
MIMTTTTITKPARRGVIGLILEWLKTVNTPRPSHDVWSGGARGL